MHTQSARATDRLILDAVLENDCLHRRRSKFRVAAIEPHNGGFFVQDENGLVYHIASDIASPLLSLMTEKDAPRFSVNIREDRIPGFQKNHWLIIPKLDVAEFGSIEERFQHTPYLSVPLPEHFFDMPILLSQSNAASGMLPGVSDLMTLVSAYLRENESTYGALADELGDWMTHISINERVLKVPLSLSCRRAIELADKVGATEQRSIIYMGPGRRMMTHRREHQLRLGELDDQLHSNLWEWLKYTDLGFAEIDFSTEKATLIAVYNESLAGMIGQIPAAHWILHFVSETQVQPNGR